MEINEEHLAHLLKLAKLELQDNEKQKILTDMNKILEMVNIINKLDLSNIEPFKYTGLQKLILREDIAGKSLTQEETLKNAKDVNFPFFCVPKVIKDSSQQKYGTE